MANELKRIPQQNMNEFLRLHPWMTVLDNSAIHAACWAWLSTRPVETGNRYIRLNSGGFVPHAQYKCCGCEQIFRTEHSAKFHECSANAVDSGRWLEAN